jgi:protoporphyrinogen oxidase
MDSTNDQFNNVIILGGGPAGLAAGYVLTQADVSTLTLEKSQNVGGLARTLEHDGFRFDLGGHRFITDNEKLESIVRRVLGDEILVVTRSSKILLNDRYFDYPINPWRAMLGVGFSTSIRIMTEYVLGQVILRTRKPGMVSFEDKIICRFGKTMFQIFFKGYSEKVWGISCDRISSEWVDRRIQGLSLWKALVHAVFKPRHLQLRTLADKFLYPQFGIGQISENLKSEIERKNPIITRSEIVRINHANNCIESVVVKSDLGMREFYGNEFISSIPLSSVAKLLDPLPPDEILQAASRLRFRDLVVVTVMIDRESVTDQTWIYIPDPSVPFGRIHEPKNWSSKMAPAGKTHLVVEYFCFRGEAIWNSSDEELRDLTVRHLDELSILCQDEVIDCVVSRVPQAYPLFEVDFQNHQKALFDYFDRFGNLHLIGRGGRFEYFNSDHAMESGIAAAESIISLASSTADSDEGLVTGLRL